MTEPSLRFATCAAVILLGPLAVAAQGFHVEYETDDRGGIHSRLVNDSEKPIEAFFWSEHCESGLWGGGERSVLDGPGTVSGDMHGADGGRPGKAGVERGGWWELGHGSKSSAATGMRECDRQVDAVVFSDGTYEGKEAAARVIKAHIDGVQARLQYWIERFNGENPDGSTLEALRAEARRIEREDLAGMVRQPFQANADEPLSPLREFWSGRRQVDKDILAWLPTEGSAYKADECFKRVLHLLSSWEKRIETDEARKKLEAVFPAISAGEPEARGSFDRPQP